MTSLTPYLIRSIYEWILDNDFTPHILVNTEIEGTIVPINFVKNGKIILNINPMALRDMIMDNDALSFNTSFSGAEIDINVPIIAIMAIYSKETGQGMIFDYDNTSVPSPDNIATVDKNKLRIVK